MVGANKSLPPGDAASVACLRGKRDRTWRSGMAAAFILAWLAAEIAHQADEAKRLR